MTLKVTQLKPNPSGKDVTFHGALAGQLAGEWVDIANDGVRPFDLRRLNLYHRAYSVIDSGGSFQDELHPGQILRIHSGRVREIDVIRLADRVGADRHGFTGRDSYIWNNPTRTRRQFGNRRRESSLIERSTHRSRQRGWCSFASGMPLFQDSHRACLLAWRPSEGCDDQASVEAE